MPEPWNNDDVFCSIPWKGRLNLSHPKLFILKGYVNSWGIWKAEWSEHSRRHLLLPDPQNFMVFTAFTQIIPELATRKISNTSLFRNFIFHFLWKWTIQIALSNLFPCPYPIKRRDLIITWGKKALNYLGLKGKIIKALPSCKNLIHTHKIVEFM